MQKSQEIRTYEAVEASLSPFSSISLAYRELYWSRHVIWHLFARDFIAGFRQKMLGYLWIVLAPLLSIASFVFMQMTGILNPGELGIPYPLFVYMGTTLWGLLISSISTVANGLISNTDLVMRTNIPKIGLAVTGMASLCYNFIVNTVVLFLLLLVFQLMPSPLALFYPIIVLPIIMLGVGIGLILAVVGAVARDITGMFVTLINLVMYITPVIYTAQFKDPLLMEMVRWNPLTYLVDAPRSLFVLGIMPERTGFIVATGVSLTVLWLGIHAFYLIKDKVTERL